MQKASIVVHADWDADAAVWVATSTDLPGLVTEAETLPALQKKLEPMVRDLLEARNEIGDYLSEVPLVLLSQSISKVRLRA